MRVQGKPRVQDKGAPSGSRELSLLSLAFTGQVRIA